MYLIELSEYSTVQELELNDYFETRKDTERHVYNYIVSYGTQEIVQHSSDKKPKYFWLFI